VSRPTIGIRFCGGCNPRIDRGRIARELEQALAAMGHPVVYNSDGADLVIFLSGCLSGCAFKYNPKDPPYIAVAATTVDGEEAGEDRIVPEVLRKVRQYDERLETDIRKENHDGLRGRQAG
jgi:hypothetical protein